MRALTPARLRAFVAFEVELSDWPGSTENICRRCLFAWRRNRARLVS
ncbi:MAG TPA: hypothetical protein VFR23_05220 [Jiangellaceae bacterium]|nr:hypothetical protein [Jiangellaceae bacterium]